MKTALIPDCVRKVLVTVKIVPGASRVWKMPHYMEAKDTLH
jgi:hypothetical protein